MNYKSTVDVGIEPRTPALGATLSGIDAKTPLDEATIGTIHSALLKYKVVFLPGQNLNSDEQHAFAGQLGEPYQSRRRLPTTTYERDPGLSKLTVVSHFHSDDMFMPEHPQLAVLQMLEVPNVGGDTMWADMVSCYEGLSEAFRETLDKLTGIHAHPDYYVDERSLQQRYGQQGQAELSPAEIEELRASLAPNEHPLVRSIPETGKKTLWASPRHTRRIKELTEAESEMVLQFLFKIQIRPEYVLRYQWRAGDIAIWDHRTTLHSGVNDFGSATRKGRRANIGSSTPVRSLPN